MPLLIWLLRCQYSRLGQYVQRTGIYQRFQNLLSSVIFSAITVNSQLSTTTTTTNSPPPCIIIQDASNNIMLQEVYRQNGTAAVSWQEYTQMPTQTPFSSNPTSIATSNPLLQSNALWPFGALFLASLASSTSSSPPSGHAPVSENSSSYAQSIGTSSGETLGSPGFLLPGDIPLTTTPPLPPETISPGAQVTPNVQSSTSVLPSLGEPSNPVLTPASPTLISSYTPFESYVTAEDGNVIGSQTFILFESSATDAQGVIGSQTFTPFENSITESGGNI